MEEDQPAGEPWPNGVVVTLACLRLFMPTRLVAAEGWKLSEKRKEIELPGYTHRDRRHPAAHAIRFPQLPSLSSAWPRAIGSD